ncbi:GNAT family N-acetyltransferase [Psychrobacillus sp. OK032]|uniref:GNAT family N-acetyltransferase n=1 Tax=Psychrobacillus sp. OK032 TaxID=1884358 RepID=UPI0008C61732|nr:GNAT family N-acetyltransferase [Psychrobacillus sp. OK032]SES42305.1 ribosomal-protein-alanine N-acetyltransferase [Psychrobacillus sp. OK032]
MNFNPFPTIETKNLLLRRMVESDRNDIHEMRKDPQMNEYTDSKEDENVSETTAYIEKMSKGIEQNKWIIWAIEHKLTQKVIGSISIWNINVELKSGELGYGIIPSFQGKGLMKEALQNVVKYGFNEMKLKEIVAFTEENNIASLRLLEKCQFLQIDRMEEDGYFKKQVFQMNVYQLKNNTISANS